MGRIEARSAGEALRTAEHEALWTAMDGLVTDVFGAARLLRMVVGSPHGQESTVIGGVAAVARLLDLIAERGQVDLLSPS